MQNIHLKSSILSLLQLYYCFGRGWSEWNVDFDWGALFDACDRTSIANSVFICRCWRFSRRTGLFSRYATSFLFCLQIRYTRARALLFVSCRRWHFHMVWARCPWLIDNRLTRLSLPDNVPIAGISRISFFSSFIIRLRNLVRRILLWIVLLFLY